MLKLKISICLVWIFFTVLLISFETFSTATAQTKATLPANKINLDLKPEHLLIEQFDNAIQRRFLTEPDFGMRRIVPVNPPSPHLEYFNPINNDEETSVANFAKDGWKVSLYLFGRKTMPKVVNGKVKDDFVINYHLNKPLPITKDLKGKSLPPAGKLIKEVKAAFLNFQTPDSLNENEYEFSKGKWFYIAKPVRAVNQSCLKCHTDYVITEKLEDGKYKFRKRRIGDANGVIVYGFTKND